MVREEPEESSNSPSVNFIHSVQKRGNSGSLFTVETSEGSSFFISSDILEHRDEWISPGSSLSEDRILRLEALQEETQCRIKALDLLARRNHFKQELFIKLMQRNFSKYYIDRSLDWLEHKGYLNDNELARDWIRKKIKKGLKSRKALEGELRNKGLSNEILSDTLFLFTEEEEEKILIRVLEKYRAKKAIDKDKMIQRLVRKGFSYAMIKRVWEES